MFPISAAHTQIIGVTKMFLGLQRTQSYTNTHTKQNEQWKFNSKFAFHSIFIQFIK